MVTTFRLCYTEFMDSQDNQPWAPKDDAPAVGGDVNSVDDNQQLDTNNKQNQETPVDDVSTNETSTESPATGVAMDAVMPSSNAIDGQSDSNDEVTSINETNTEVTEPVANNDTESSIPQSVFDDIASAEPTAPTFSPFDGVQDATQTTPTTATTTSASSTAPVEQANQPTATSQSQPGQVIQPEPKKKKSGLKIALFIGIPILVILLGVFIWYFAIFNEKTNVVKAAMSNLMSQRDNSAKYSLEMSEDDMSVTISGNISYLANGSMSADADVEIDTGVEMPSSFSNLGSISVINDNKALYIKPSLSDSTQAMISTFANTYSTNNTDLSVIFDTINDKWIKVDYDLLTSNVASASSAKGADSLKCIETVTDKLDDKISRQQLIDSLFDSGVLSVTGVEKDANGKYYVININQDKYDEYIDLLVKTNVFNTLSSCLGSDSKGEPLTAETLKENIDTETITDTSYKMYISGWNRQVDRIEISGKQGSASFSASLQYANKIPEIKAPEDATDIEDAMQELMQKIMLQQSSGRDIEIYTNDEFDVINTTDDALVGPSLQDIPTGIISSGFIKAFSDQLKD